MGDDVEAAVAWYTTHLGFTLLSKHVPAFADVARGSLRLLLSGPTSSAGRPMPDGERSWSKRRSIRAAGRGAEGRRRRGLQLVSSSTVRFQQSAVLARWLQRHSP